MISCVFGNNIGNFIFGISIRFDGNPDPGLTSYLKRNFYIWSLGFGCMIPGLNIVALIVQWFASTGASGASWDRRCKTVVLSPRGNETRVLIGIVALLIVQDILTSFRGSRETTTPDALLNSIKEEKRNLPRRLSDSIVAVDITLEKQTIANDFDLRVRTGDPIPVTDDLRQKLLSELRPKVEAYYCSKSTKLLRDAGYSMSWTYRGLDNETLFIVLAPSDCP